MKKIQRVAAIFLTVILAVGILDVGTFAGTDVTKTDVAVASITKTDIATSRLSREELALVYDPKNYENDFVLGEVIVGLNARNTRADVRALFPELKIAGIEDLYAPYVSYIETSDIRTRERLADNGSEERLSNLREKVGTVYIITLPDKTRDSVLNAINLLRSNPYVAYAEPSYKSQFGFNEPNDPLYPSQPHFNILQAPLAWGFTTGSHSVKVGVIDSGVDYTHPDLIDNLDMSLAHNTLTNSNSDMEDTYPHGTMVAGVLGAVGNNGIGVSGVNWDVTIVPIKAANIWGEPTQPLLTLAVEHATYLDLPITNMSAHVPTAYVFYEAVSNYNGLFVTIAGNRPQGGISIENYPMYKELVELGNVIFVAASESGGALRYDSNYGLTIVALSAPGTDIRSTQINHTYAFAGMTSLAAPQVAGAAALILSIRPEFTPQDLKCAILNSVDTHPGLAGYVTTGGRLNLNKTIATVASKLPTTISDLSYNGESYSFTNINFYDVDSFWSGKTVYAVINKYNGSDLIATARGTAFVSINSGGPNDGLRVPLSPYQEVATFMPGEHIEILIYKEFAHNYLITRLIVDPVLFEFLAP